MQDFSPQADDAVESVSKTLRLHGIVPTGQRVQIARLILTQAMHFSAEQLYDAVNRSSGGVSKATVYNTIGLFVDRGLLRRVLVDPNRVFYDSNTASHHHFYNVESGELEDIDARQVSIGALPEPPRGLEVEGVDVVVRVRQSARKENGS